MKRFFRIPTLLLLLALPFAGYANGPELSADRPITFSAETGMLIASGNAVFVEENTRVEAEEIRYNRESSFIEAEGNVRVTRTGVRLLAEYLTYNTVTREFSARNFRAGYPPVFLEGAAFSGNLDEIAFEEVTVHVGEPNPSTPSLRFAQGRYVAGESLSGSQVRLLPLGDFPIPLPDLTYTFGQPSFSFNSRGGFSEHLGAFLDTTFLYPYTRTLSLGGNLGFFSDRGVLVGPALQWISPRGLTLSLNTGWIRDHNTSERAFDFTGSPIDRERGFIELDFHAISPDLRHQLSAQAHYLSDSEVLRDFRESTYLRDLQPDHFLDYNFQQGPFLLNLFSRAQINDYYGMVEKLPEVRMEYLPSEIQETGVYLQAFTVATRYRQHRLTPSVRTFTPPANPLGLPGFISTPGLLPADLTASQYFNRLEGGLTVTRPFALPQGIDLVLRAGGRWSHYQAEATDESPSLSEERLIGELGFDLSQTLTRTYHLSRPDWNVTRLRHFSRPFLQYRWHPGAEEKAALIPAFELRPYSPLAPIIDLADLSFADGLREWSVVRLGWEHRFQVAGENGRFRDWLKLGLMQDLRLDSPSGESNWDGLYFNADFQPFSWLRFQYLHKVRPDEGVTEATLFRATISSSDLWSVSLLTEYLEGAFEQYELQGQYRFAQNWGISGRWRYNATADEFTRQEYGLQRRLGNLWVLELYLSSANDDQRNADFGVGLRLSLLNF